MYVNGDGVLKDYKQAIYWLEKATEQEEDNALAIVVLASLYANGDGVLKDYKKAFKMYEKAARIDDKSYGSGYGQYYLGVMYIEGKGTQKSLKNAAYWINKAYESGNNDAEKTWNKYELWNY